MDSGPICIRFVNNLEEHIEAARILYARSMLAKADKVVAGLLFAFGVYSIAVTGLHWWTPISFVLAAVEWFNLLSPIRWKTKMEFNRTPKFREEYLLTFSDANIYFKTESLESTMLWTYYERVIESPTLFILLYGKGMYSVIPKRCFSSDSEMSAFRALLKRSIPEKASAAA